jgi:membrane-bound metal-dependent hydrolase YbcI (DUF457 family)
MRADSAPAGFSAVAAGRALGLRAVVSGVSLSRGIAVPGFQVHITGSTIVGAGYAAAAWWIGDMPPMTCALAGGLCAVAGMMPDLDSGPGIPLKESVAFAAAVIPMMMLHRFHQMGLPMEGMILAGAGIYLAIRFGMSWLLKHYAVHRGMFHSLPAALIAGQVAFLAFSAEDPLRRYFISSAVILGFLTHLVLDEIWSVKLGLFGPKVKKSFGTALKFYGTEAWSNLLSYVLLIVLGLLASKDASLNERMHTMRQQVEQASRQYVPTQAPWQYRR